MPALDFKCQECGEKFFEIVSSSNRDKVACPKCGSKDIKQVFEGKCNSGGATKGGGGGCNSGSCNSCSGCH